VRGRGGARGSGWSPASPLRKCSRKRAVGDAIDERLAPIEASPELLALLKKRSDDFANGAPGVPFDEVMARLRRR